MVWQLQETWALQVECSSSILPIAWRHTTNICLVYTKFNALSYGYKLLFFGWPIALHGLVHFLNTSSLRLFWPHLTWMYMNVYRAYGPMGLWGHKLLNNIEHIVFIHSKDWVFGGLFNCGFRIFSQNEFRKSQIKKRTNQPSWLNKFPALWSIWSLPLAPSTAAHSWQQHGQTHWFQAAEQHEGGPL